MRLSDRLDSRQRLPCRPLRRVPGWLAAVLNYKGIPRQENSPAISGLDRIAVLSGF